jgi:hypothetical protein
MTKNLRRLSLLLMLGSLIPSSCVFGQRAETAKHKHQRYFQEYTYWKGPIEVIPHSLYRGSGLSHQGSFFFGERKSLIRVDLPEGKEKVVVKNNPEEYAFASIVSPDDRQVAYQ